MGYSFSVLAIFSLPCLFSRCNCSLDCICTYLSSLPPPFICIPWLQKHGCTYSFKITILSSIPGKLKASLAGFKAIWDILQIGCTFIAYSPFSKKVIFVTNYFYNVQLCNNPSHSCHKWQILRPESKTWNLVTPSLKKEIRVEYTLLLRICTIFLIRPIVLVLEFKIILATFYLRYFLQRSDLMFIKNKIKYSQHSYLSAI